MVYVKPTLAAPSSVVTSTAISSSSSNDCVASSRTSSGGTLYNRVEKSVTVSMTIGRSQPVDMKLRPEIDGDIRHGRWSSTAGAR